MKSSKPPPAPDYTAAAKETAAGNYQMAQYATNANRINQVTPWGTLTYDYKPQYDAQGKETGMGWTQTETLTPEAQAALNQELALNRKYGEVANIGFDSARQLFENPQLNTSGVSGGATGVDLSGLPQGGERMAMPGRMPGLSTRGLPGLTQPGQSLPELTQAGQNLPGLSRPDLAGLPPAAQANIAAQGAKLNLGALSALPGGIDLNGLPTRGTGQGQTALQAMMSRLQPQLQQQEEALRTRLANQGIGLGSEAYQREQAMQGQRANDLNLQAAAQAIGLDEQIRAAALNEQLSAGNFDLARRGQTLQEQLASANVANQGAQMGLQAQIANAQLANQTRGQLFGEQMDLAGLSRADRQQMFGEQMDLAGLNRSDRQQLFGEQMGLAGLNRSDRAQLFGERGTIFDANRATQNDQFSQGLQANQFNQSLQNQALQNQMAAQGFNQNLRQQQLAEQAYLQDRPLNLINALRSGNQVQSPQFQQFAMQGATQGPDIMGAQNAQYQAAIAANNARNAGRAGMFGGLLNAGMGIAGLGMAGGGTLGGNVLGGLFGMRPPGG